MFTQNSAMKKQRKALDPKKDKPLFGLAIIVIPTVVIVLVTLAILSINGAFTSPQKKMIGTWCRERVGAYSMERYVETYVFNSDGTGQKSSLSPDGYTAHSDFTWSVTEKKVLVINGVVKYNWNANVSDYYTEGKRSTKKYWYVSKNDFFIGENTSPTYEAYERVADGKGAESMGNSNGSIGHDSTEKVTDESGQLQK